MNLEALIHQWQQKLNTLNHSPHTIKAYTQDLFDFKNFFEDYNNQQLNLENFKSLKSQDIRAWLLFRRKKGINTRSSARGLAGLKNFSEFLLEQNILNDHAFFHVRSPKLQKTLPRPISIDQALLITDTIHNMSHSPWVGLRNQALIQLLYFTGIRISEALSLNQKSLSNTQFITVIGKRSKVRQVPIDSSTKEKILLYLKEQPFLSHPESPIFFGEKGKRLQAAVVQKILRDFRRSTGMPESLTPHALRHSCATHLMQSSHDLRGIQELLGHSSLSSTQIYTQIDEMSMMNTYKSAHPRAKK
ncbi:MAG: tyrosine recombinase XerC [Pseudomonadota bacterium]|jgi:integrase/recombinase XerC|nr:tyrosine recombinase XerC [Alphaproteobacteria bacterium]